MVKTNNPRVILPEVPPHHNTDGAKTFGELHYLTDSVFNPYNSRGNAKIMLRELDEMTYHPQIDYLCMTGPVVVLAVLLAVVRYEYSGYIRMLVFDPRTNTYQVDILEEPNYVPIESDGANDASVSGAVG